MAAPTKRRKTAPATAKRQLAAYNAKRKLNESGEPSGGSVEGSSGAVRRFVIQKHDATRLHYDLRLEMDGVYRSWAVPKGLPLEPGERNLAVEVEDHPLEYGNFEGVIPEGNYGAGTVMLWDRGHYTVSGVPAETAYRQGKMHMAFAGEKAVGEWTLVRLPKQSGGPKTNWLLIKNNSPAYDAPMRAERDVSVLSGRTLEQIAGEEPAGPSRRSSGTKKPGPSKPPRGASRRSSGETGRDRIQAAAPKRRGTSKHSTSAANLAPAEYVAPMKALSVEAIPDGDWRLEIKLDGYRAVAVINGDQIELWSRNHKPLTGEYPEVIEALRAVRCANAVIDGEIVALDEEGRSRFQLLQNRDTRERPPIVYYVFDLLHHDGRSLLKTPIEERQIALEVLVGKGSEALRFSPVFQVPPEKLLEQVRAQQLEGIIAKAAGSLYEPDRRSGSWLKCKVHGEQEFVIGGFTPPKNSRTYFGAILVGYYDKGRLMYAGKVGSGFNGALLRTLHEQFMKRSTDACPFANLPMARRSRFGGGMTAATMRGVTWLKPELVAQVRFTEWTEDGSLRHPVFIGLRDDKRAKDVVRETGGGNDA